MASVGSRLREERKRLRIAQIKFAEIIGIDRKTQYLYENDERQPDSDYFAESSKIGIDILYVITGQRTPGHELIQAVRAKYGPHLALAELAESIERIEEAEAAAGRAKTRDDLERWASAIAAVEEGLSQTGRRLEPASKAELILAAYDLLEEDSSSARDRVIRLVAAA